MHRLIHLDSLDIRLMSQSSLQANRFYREVAKNKILWTIKDKKGFPAPVNREGRRIIPFWSQLETVEKIIKGIPAYNGFIPHKLNWSEFVSKWLPGMIKDRMLVGLNWSGEKATGYDCEPLEVQKNIETFMLEK